MKLEGRTIMDDLRCYQSLLIIAHIPGCGHPAKERMAHPVCWVGHLVSPGVVDWLCSRVASI